MFLIISMFTVEKFVICDDLLSWKSCVNTDDYGTCKNFSRRPCHGHGMVTWDGLLMTPSDGAQGRR